MDREIARRLRWARMLQETGNAGLVCLRCGISRPTLRKWARPRLSVLDEGHGITRVWARKGHDHGAALAQELGYAPVYLHYNTGLHGSTNGHEFGDLNSSGIRVRGDGLVQRCRRVTPRYRRRFGTHMVLVHDVLTRR
jgi:hypothetical protein